MPEKDKPWIFRTYAGHTSAQASNALYKTNLAKGQTGLSVAFDLPTQTGYDADHPLARGEVGKVGVPISHIQDMRQLFDGIPLDQMNTSMTINATAAWLLALYVAVAEEQGHDRQTLQGTTQNDILKEYLSRGTYAFPPKPSLRLTADMIEFCVNEIPKWNPINVCSYHLQEAGATPVQEIAFTLANAIEYLDLVKKRNALTSELVGSVSFFCNAGIRFIEETCKMRAFTKMWDEICRTRYGVQDEKLRRFRYGVQVNSLGLTSAQPENNIHRITLEMLGVTLSKNARARAVQLPAWNEALGLPRPWDQQWSLRAQQILALESDILDYEDIFEGSKVIESKTNELINDAQQELDKVLEMGGSVEALDYMKEQMVMSHATQLRNIEDSTTTRVGINKYTETAESPLDAQQILSVDETSSRDQIEALERHRKARPSVTKALDQLKFATKNEDNIMLASINAARAGVTTGEWAQALREVFGDYRAPTGMSAATPLGTTGIDEARDAAKNAAERLGVTRIKILVAKAGLDGHSNGAEQVAIRARDMGMEVIYEGIRNTPAAIARTAADEQVHVIGLSILSGGHEIVVGDVLNELRALDLDVPVFVGGTIPTADATKLRQLGVKQVFTPDDWDLTKSLTRLVELLG